MATMTVRTTVAFDPATAARLERLAKRWGVSKSETMRRALESAEIGQPVPPASTQPTEQEIAAMSPREALAWLRTNPQPRIPGGWGDNPTEELREMREQDGLLEEERERERRPAR